MAVVQWKTDVQIPASQITSELGVIVIAGLKRRLDVALAVILSAVKAKLSQGGSGVMYRSKRGDGSFHIASAPGEPPAPDTTGIRESFYTEVVASESEVKGMLQSDRWSTGGQRLELGGFGGNAYIAPRPYVRPVLDETEAEIDQILNGDRE